jgi:hypothetical protein
MGINDIHILVEDPYNAMALHQAQVAHEEKLKADHRNGLHPYGSMRRDCPLCQAGK